MSDPLVRIRLSKLVAILAAMDGARVLAHDKVSKERDNAFLDLAWQSGIVQSYVNEAKKRTQEPVES